MEQIDTSQAVWFKSSRSSGNGQCTMCAHLGEDGTAVKDSKDPEGGILVFSRAGWQTFIAGIKIS